MTAITDPATGLKLYELGHRWGYNSPTWPGYEDIKIERMTYHAKHGVMTQRIVTIMHTGTHLNAPIHLVPGGAGVGELPMDLFFGTGVVVGIPKGEWELITVDDLKAAKPAIRRRDIVIINTGWHKKYADSQEYFGHGPGLSGEAAAWLAARKVKLVGVDTAAVDHPMATSIGPHRNGPQISYVLPRYREKFGRDAIDDFPEWNPAHRALLEKGIPTVENVGGDVDVVTGKRCTFHAYPWEWVEGDACVIRLVAMLDPTGDYRVESGRKVRRKSKPAAKRRARR